MTVPPYPGQPDPGRPNPYAPPPQGRPPAYGQPPQYPQQPGQPYPRQPGQPPQYPQQPGYGQYPPPGQPGYGQQPGAYGSTPLPPAPFGEPPPPRKRRGLWLRIGVPAAVLVLLGLGALVRNLPLGGWTAEEGECLSVPEFSTTAQEDPEKVDCGDPSANVKVAVRLSDGGESCPQGDYDYLATEDTKLCLMLNAKNGECWANVTSSTKGYARVPCTDPSAEIQVVKVVEGQTDPAKACSGTEAATGAVYTRPPTVVCLAQPKTV
ncbi:LppU/SCO3897 family protein [Prauserella endophytica]|uniref:Serine/threonine protein kinase n=1 Tax=Prauserella endophytica TaxID=1592324 RepID=A0ABY2RSH8_9PSEU|nr:hypothetical protein [Prauserella endophytica]TKG58528.1 hypothetical protein FCN18_37730 [Prauserella endophytica]